MLADTSPLPVAVVIHCPHCKWSGTTNDCESVNLDDNDAGCVICAKCRELIEVFPKVQRGLWSE